MWKLLELTIPKKIVNQKQFCTSGGIAEISATIKNLKDDAGVIIPTTSLLNLTIWPMQKTDGSWGITISLTRQLLLSQLLFEMWFHCWGKLTYTLVPGIQLL